MVTCYQTDRVYSGGDHEFAVETGSQPCRVMQPLARVSFTRTYECVMESLVVTIAVAL